ncbi:uncharacterized protein LOC124898028 [Capsicum annuum]|uniref:uncharacterized protein LOC124898028 n=1 Tax=Capsicum annuum TaxID=4072 RepID=UPI001FB18B4D|nr:uncharacterized protein LOC124898028 [Capsicum annuum]
MGEHTCGVDYVTRKYKNVTMEVIASLILNFFVDNKGPSPKEIKRIVFRELNCRTGYWKCWMADVIAKNIVQGTPEHGYAVFPAFSYIFNSLNPGSINSLMVMRSLVIAIDGMYLSGKYEGVLLFIVAQDTQNHIYPLAYCVVDKENDASWGFFFEKLKAFVVDEPELCIISDRHVSIANGLARHYPLAHHGVSEAYTLKEFNDYFNALKERCPSTVACLEHKVGFEKWSRAHFPGNRFNVMTSNIIESLNSILRDEREYSVAAIFNSIAHRVGEIFRKRYADIDNSKTPFVPVAKAILRENKIVGDNYIKYDLVKLPCAHAMAALRLKHGDEYDTSIYNYSSQIYSKKSYLLVYLEPICAAPLESKWSVAREYLGVQVLPLDFDSKLGRKKVKHVKSVLEPLRYKKRHKCSKCKKPGHKRITCSLNVG